MSEFKRIEQQIAVLQLGGKTRASKRVFDHGTCLDIADTMTKLFAVARAQPKLVAMIHELIGMMQQPIELQRNSAERARVLIESLTELERSSHTKEGGE